MMTRSRLIPDARSLIPLFLCALCISAAPLPIRAADPLPEPPLNWDIASEAIHAARAERAEALEFQAGQTEQALERARRGRVIGPKRDGRSWSGVDLSVNPCLFDTRERKRAELERMDQEIRTLREQADELRSPEARWMPVINLWRHHSKSGSPAVGQIGVIDCWSGDGDDADNQNSLPLEVSHVRFDGSVLVRASAEFSFRRPAREGSFLIVDDSETRTIGWFVLSGLPGAANKTTGQRLTAEGVWIVAGTTTFTTVDGGAVTTMVIERICDEHTARDLLSAESRARAARSEPSAPSPEAQPHATPYNTAHPNAAPRDTKSRPKSP